MKKLNKQELINQWKEDYLSVKQEISILSSRLDDFMDKAEKAKDIEELKTLASNTNFNIGLENIKLF